MRNRELFDNLRVSSESENSHDVSRCTKTDLPFLKFPLYRFHFEKTLACKRCDHKSYNVEGMMIHIRTHTRDKPYKCHLCPKEYTQKLSLDMHIEKLHARKKFFSFVQLCLKTVSFQPIANKNVQCIEQGCAKMFSCERMMLEHLKQKERWRTKPKKFKCELVGCMASFKTSQERSKHYVKRHPDHPVFKLGAEVNILHDHQ